MRLRTVCFKSLFLFLLSTPVLSTGVVQSEDGASSADTFLTHYEKSGKKESADYLTTIRFYQRLADQYDRVEIREAGRTDSGYPLHVVFLAEDTSIVAPDRVAVSAGQRARQNVLLINNAIHPGEPDGVDASMMLARELAQKGLPQNVIVAIIPMYNIGGALNRNSTTRANQNGPLDYGFRGNAQNYDLNRDFIKCDTRNARSFSKIFQSLDPELLIDTHVSNGADYQYVMTSAHSQKDKLGGRLGVFFDQTFRPEIFGEMNRVGFPVIPYVNSGGAPPDRGFSQFLETPRYSTGYAALFQTMGFMTETHMLKPYDQRVDATYAFLHNAIRLLSKHGETIKEIRESDRRSYLEQDAIAVSWTLDRERSTKIRFLGYEARTIPSRVTTGSRLFYDRKQPFDREVDYYNHYVPKATVRPPAGYLIPRGWNSIIERLKINGVEMRALSEVTELKVEVYRVIDLETPSSPFEGHYPHRSIELSTKTMTVTAKAGDVVVPFKQRRARYVVETLEPLGSDSFFRWNFFDTILQQKEHFSPYVFEDIAERLLEDKPELRKRFEAKQESDDEFRASDRQQLQFLYQNSPHYEAAHRTYPVSRLID
ncbi:MAG: hypothetical protein AAF802_14985 [Planctomycetota bacterium]